MLGHVGRHIECDAGLRDLQIGSIDHIIITHSDRQRVVVVVKEVVALDGHLFACISPLVAHRTDCRCGNDDLEVVGHGVLRCGDEVDLVGHYIGDILRHAQDDGVVGHVTCIERGRLVVEVDLLHAAQVATYDTERVAHGGFGDERILRSHINRTDIIDGGLAVGGLILVGLVFARCETCRHCGESHGKHGLVYILDFHNYQLFG